jgi:hypothetical protein
MLLVTCIEALISPRAEWGKPKVTQRFIKSLQAPRSSVIGLPALEPVGDSNTSPPMPLIELAKPESVDRLIG